MNGEKPTPGSFEEGIVESKEAEKNEALDALYSELAKLNVAQGEFDDVNGKKWLGVLNKDSSKQKAALDAAKAAALAQYKKVKIAGSAEPVADAYAKALGGDSEKIAKNAAVIGKLSAELSAMDATSAPATPTSVEAVGTTEGIPGVDDIDIAPVATPAAPEATPASPAGDDLGGKTAVMPPPAPTDSKTIGDTSVDPYAETMKLAPAPAAPPAEPPAGPPSPPEGPTKPGVGDLVKELATSESSSGPAAPEAGTPPPAGPPAPPAPPTEPPADDAEKAAPSKTESVTEKIEASLDKITDEKVRKQVETAIGVNKRETEDLEKRYGKGFLGGIKKFIGESALGRSIEGIGKIIAGVTMLKASEASFLTGVGGALIGPSLFAHGAKYGIEGTIQLIQSIGEIKFDRNISKARGEISKLTQELSAELEKSEVDYTVLADKAKAIREMEAEILDNKASRMSTRAKWNLTSLWSGVVGSVIGAGLHGLPTGIQAFKGIQIAGHMVSQPGHSTLFDLTKGWMFSYKGEGEIVNAAATATAHGIAPAKVSAIGAAGVHTGHAIGTTTLPLIGGLALAAGSMAVMAKREAKTAAALKEAAAEMKKKAAEMKDDPFGDKAEVAKAEAEAKKLADEAKAAETKPAPTPEEPGGGPTKPGGPDKPGGPGAPKPPEGGAGAVATPAEAEGVKKVETSGDAELDKLITDFDEKVEKIEDLGGNIFDITPEEVLDKYSDRVEQALFNEIDLKDLTPEEVGSLKSVLSELGPVLDKWLVENKEESGKSGYVELSSLYAKVRELGSKPNDILPQELRDKMSKFGKNVKAHKNLPEAEFNQLMALKTEAKSILENWIAEKEKEKPEEVAVGALEERAKTRIEVGKTYTSMLTEKHSGSTKTYTGQIGERKVAAIVVEDSEPGEDLSNQVLEAKVIKYEPGAEGKGPWVAHVLVKGGEALEAPAPTGDTKPEIEVPVDRVAELNIEAAAVFTEMFKSGAEWRAIKNSSGKIRARDVNKPESKLADAMIARGAKYQVIEFKPNGLNSKVTFKQMDQDGAPTLETTYKAFIHAMDPVGAESIVAKASKKKRGGAEKQVREEMLKWVKENIEKPKKPTDIAEAVVESPAKVAEKPEDKTGDDLIDLLAEGSEDKDKEKPALVKEPETPAEDEEPETPPIKTEPTTVVAPEPAVVGGEEPAVVTTPEPTVIETPEPAVVEAPAATEVSGPWEEVPEINYRDRDGEDVLIQPGMSILNSVGKKTPILSIEKRGDKFRLITSTEPKGGVSSDKLNNPSEGLTINA